MIEFIKMHGLGNDFVLIDCRLKSDLKLSAEEIQILGNRRRGIGFDQIIFIRGSEKADAYMDMYNNDGGMIEACGNGTRCLAGFLMDESHKDAVSIETPVDILTVKRASNKGVTVDMGIPSIPDLSKQVNSDNLPISLSFSKENLMSCAVSMGNPHAVCFVENVAEIDLEREGPLIESDPLFPNKTNVEFVQQLDHSKLRMRVWERGAGVTEACGTGACATVVAAVKSGFVEKGQEIEVVLDGGSLYITWVENNHVMMTGPYLYLFKGEIDLSRL
ncbi:MAG: diaminopimelate epimerase [Alphaproteobacteria bacterium]|nr:diaminopimelate epimerase [Alphaproteobacteria bacterium]MBN2780154.1 diaminopimelate epimerase [Alphaproteobacteria bacterium]